MFRSLLKKEILANLYNQRYVITLVLLVALVALSVWTLQRSQEILLAQHAESMLRYADDAKGSRDVWGFLRRGLATEKKPEPLAALGRGLDAEMTRSITYSGWNEIVVGEPKNFSPLFRMYASPDLIYIIQVVGSLLALLFVYDAICGEKEQGTLRLTLTYPVPRDRILLAKWLGGVVSLCVPLVLAVLGTAVYLCFVPSFEFSVDHAVRFLLIVLLSVLYLSTFFTLGLLVSCLARDSTMSLMICLFLWITLVLAVPNLMPMIARGVRPIPSEGKIAMEKMHKRREVEEWAGNTIRAQIHDQDEYFETVARLVAKALEGIDQFRRNRVQEQITLAQNLSRISPSACYVFASSDLARTGVASFLRYQRYVIWYRHLFNDAKDRLMAKAREKATEGRWWEVPVTDQDLGMFPRFDPLDTSFTASVRSVLLDVALLLGFQAVFFLGAYTVFLRYDVR